MFDKIKLDEIDQKILSILSNNARIQWRQIGEEIHMTGQAVGERIKRLTQVGVIKGYYTAIDKGLFSTSHEDYITVILVSGNHKEFLELVHMTPKIKEAYRTSGNGCYLLKVETESKIELEQLLERIIPFGNYQVNSVISKFK